MITRRSLLAGAGLGLLAVSAASVPKALSIKLWGDMDPPGGGGPAGPESWTSYGGLSNITTPSMDVYVPQKPNGSAILIAGGGGYKRIGIGNEAVPAASWLIEQGITAFVLRYRLPGENWQAGPAAPLQDAQRAIRLIRSEAQRYRIDPRRIGVLGFSAGGHLAGMAAATSSSSSYSPIDAIDTLSPRPDFAALIYPVITLEPPYDHTSTRLSLVGRHPAEEESARWSVQTHVGEDCPPMFLVQAVDDAVSDPANTLIMKEACDAAGVPVEMHRLASGGHGFGMGREGTPTADWPGYFAAWLANRSK